MPRNSVALNIQEHGVKLIEIERMLLREIIASRTKTIYVNKIGLGVIQGKASVREKLKPLKDSMPVSSKGLLLC